MQSKKYSPVPALLQLWRRHRLLGWVVVFPTLVAALYFGLIASDMYVSESRFIVRSPDKQTVSPLGMILKSSGFTKASEDAASIESYILSRDAMMALDHDLHIKQLYSASSIDPFSRFNSTGWGGSNEKFLLYYLKRVNVDLDPESSIIVLTTHAFTAQSAHDINLKLLEHAEDLVNQLNDRSQQDMIRFSLIEVEGLEKKDKEAALALASYRNQEGVINPEQQSAIPLQQVARLQDELIATQAQVLQVGSVAPGNPQLPILRQRAAMLEAAIKKANLGVAGGGDHSLASKASEFQRLTLEKEFSGKMLASAMASLEQARTDAMHQQLYVERIVQPSLPDKAMEPYRMRNIAATFLICLVLWGVLSLTVAAVREHND